MPHFIISALGSYGDVHPMVGLGSALAKRGHSVQLITNPYFADLVTAAGLELLPIGTSDDYARVSQHPDLWHPTRGPRLILKHASIGFMRTIYDHIAAHHQPGETVIGAHALDLGGRVAAEKLGLPIAAIDFAPAMIWSLHDSPRLKGALLGPRAPRWFKRLQFWAADTFFAQPLMGSELNSLRQELGLPPVKRIFTHWIQTADLILGLFPDWFGPPQPDWPAKSQVVGFPLWDTAESGLAPDLQKFLASGDPPIAFSPGSANREARSFFDAAVDACGRLSRRGILLTKYDDQLPPNLPPSIGHFGFVPLSALLPRTAALVHHGGIGSCAQAFAAGVPQIVRPMAYDQFDNSRRVVGLGVGEEISVRKFNGPSIAAALERLLASADVAANCRQWAARSDGNDALAAACDALEKLVRAESAR